MSFKNWCADYKGGVDIGRRGMSLQLLFHGFVSLCGTIESIPLSLGHFLKENAAQKTSWLRYGSQKMMCLSVIKKQ